ncbi:HDOD domain-containing protein [Thiohalophilus sp.]|uniref:HDOD domain-containing protein n=1 Tax=Thiohalophilus sp. TaxID=3028392 RepID=UPI002ACE86C0|nr:HDOD domain-containing protein [Thiohalophilus sp.]MDZ7804011.1 HDOD domain-containing protein [Thiohalophilus sp.]
METGKPFDELLAEQGAGMKLAERMRRLRDLPPLPETVIRILALRQHEEVNARDLIDIVEQDPVLAAQLISYANSAFFTHHSPVTAIDDAVLRVVGVSPALELALGLSVGRVLHISTDGVLGARRLWRHATYSAALMQQLAGQIPAAKRPDPGTAYLCGLLHDIGLFVLGYLFPQEHQALSQLVQRHPDVALNRLEYNLMGVSHGELGQMAMRYWDMPQMLATVARHHHNTDYDGEHETLIGLLNLVEALLSSQGLTDTPVLELDEALLERLGLEEENVILIADEVIQAGDSLEQLARQLCA